MNKLQRLGVRVADRLRLGIRKRWVPSEHRPGYSPGPRYLQIQLTYKCNLTCYFCGQWGSTGTYRGMPGSQLRSMVPLKLLTAAIDELPRFCTSILLWGGETLQYPDIAPLAKHIAGAGKSCDLVTNGTTLARQARSLVQAGVNLVQVSLDGTEQVHDRVRGARGSYRKAIEGIHELRSERSRQGRHRPTIEVSATVLSDNVEDLPNLVRESREAGVDRIWISKVMYVSEQLGRLHTEAFQELFQIQPVSWKGFARPEPFNGAGGKVRRVLAELRADPNFKDFIGWENDWSPGSFGAYYEDPQYTLPRDRACRFPWDAVCIYPNGDLSACPSFPDYVVGNLHEETFTQIWNGERFRRFREALYANRRFPICSICCQLYTEPH